MHTRTSIFASMPSLVDKMRSIVSDVPDPIVEAAGNDPVKQYLLKQASIADQQKIVMAETLEKVLEHVKITNGRVDKAEDSLAKHGNAIDELKMIKKLAGWLVLAVPAADVAIHWLAKVIGAT